MSKKRPLKSDLHPLDSPAIRPKSAALKDEGGNDRAVDVVDLRHISASEFFQRYVAERRPCVLRGLFDEKQHSQLDAKTLGDAVGDCKVEVERRADLRCSFGQNRLKDFTVEMTVTELLEKLQNPSTKNLFYLSTQEGNIHEKLMSKLDKSGVIPQSLPLSGHLIVESSNLWMGGATGPEGSSSGLHHDFHDNFYVLHAGRKQFVLYPPTSKIPVYGDIEKIHPNGLISYKSNPTRADGVPLAILGHATESADQGDSSDDESAEVVLGKGFDYVSSDEDGEDEEKIQIGSDKNDEANDFVHDEDNDDENEEPAYKRRPDHFSPIQISHPGDHSLKSNPIIGDLEPRVINLKAGDGLYLPASWFHCVFSSTAAQDTSIHLAVNYWYHPPDNLDNFEQPYQDCQYWNAQAKK